MKLARLSSGSAMRSRAWSPSACGSLACPAGRAPSGAAASVSRPTAPRMVASASTGGPSAPGSGSQTRVAQTRASASTSPGACGGRSAGSLIAARTSSGQRSLHCDIAATSSAPRPGRCPPRASANLRSESTNLSTAQGQWRATCAARVWPASGTAGSTKRAISARGPAPTCGASAAMENSIASSVMCLRPANGPRKSVSSSPAGSSAYGSTTTYERPPFHAPPRPSRTPRGRHSSRAAAGMARKAARDCTARTSSRTPVPAD